MNPKDWLWLAFEVIAILSFVLTFVWKAIKQPIDYELKDIKEKLTEGLKAQGSRIGNVESAGEVRDKEIENLKRLDQQHSFEVAALQREHGRFEGMLEKVEEAQQLQAKTNTEILVQLGRLDTKMNVFSELREVMGAVLEHRKADSKGRHS